MNLSSVSSNTGPGNAESTSHTSTPDKTLKRKFEDAIRNLDEAVGPSFFEDNTPPAKKPKTGRSLYSTLAKYGITTKKETKQDDSAQKLESISKTAPHLAAILSRTVTRTRKAFPFGLGRSSSSASVNMPAPSTPGSEYRPSSTKSFLTRLATFKLTTYANKPSAIDAVAAAKCGWINDGKDRLVCGICDVSWIVAGKEGMSRDAANAFVEKQRVSLVNMHKDGCPWKKGHCDDSIYCVPLQTPTNMAKELKTRAAKMDATLRDIQIKHPLTPAQLQPLLSALKDVKVTQPPPPSDSISTAGHEDDPMGLAGTILTEEPSETAILIALFGWAVTQPEPANETSRTPSLSRANTLTAMSAAHARQSISFSPSASRSTTPVPGAISLSRTSTNAGRPKQDSSILVCPLCQRRVGLWAFLPPPQNKEATQTSSDGAMGDGAASGASTQQPLRKLDILKEHRSYCPYVVKSTTIPSLPVLAPNRASSSMTNLAFLSNPSLTQMNGQTGTVEGWRAVLMVVLRHSLARKQRYGYHGSTYSLDGVSQEGAEANHLEAAVDAVKTSGGKDLLRYVKGLLG